MNDIVGTRSRRFRCSRQSCTKFHKPSSPLKNCKTKKKKARMSFRRILSHHRSSLSLLLHCRNQSSDLHPRLSLLAPSSSTPPTFPSTHFLYQCRRSFAKGRKSSMLLFSSFFCFFGCSFELSFTIYSDFLLFMISGFYICFGFSYQFDNLRKCVFIYLFLYLFIYFVFFI